MRPRSQTVTRLDYCQYLLVSQINYTLTNFADHSEKFSHDAINRYVAGERLQPRLTWENVKGQVIQTPKGYLIFDDTVADKNYSHEIELVRSQYSGNAHAVIKGIGIVTCVYVNPDLDQFWIIDYRIYDSDGDGKTKLDHVLDMLLNCVHQKRLQFWAVLKSALFCDQCRLAGLLQERGPFDIQLEPLTLRLPHPGGQMGYYVRVRFPKQRQALCRLKVEITVDEPVFLPTKTYPILHGFPEPFDAPVQGYALAEITAEKLRALLQSRERLASRGWGASRVCRDYYDLWCILGREMLTGVPPLFARKCAVRNVAFQSPEEFTSPDLVETARREWDQQLNPFLTKAPAMEKVLAEVKSLILALFRAA